MDIKKSVIYGSKAFLGAALCWYGLTLCGVPNPIWSVITVIIVSDPDLKTTKLLAKTRAINTAVGCAFGIGSLMLFGYAPLVSLLTAALTVVVVTLIERYPANWRLAPVTVIIIMDAGRMAGNHQNEIYFAMMRMAEIAIGCLVALSLSGLYTYYNVSKEKNSQKPEDSAQEQS